MQQRTSCKRLPGLPGGVKQSVVCIGLNVERSQVDWQNGCNQIFIKHDFLILSTPRMKTAGNSNLNPDLAKYFSFQYFTGIKCTERSGDRLCGDGYGVAAL